MWFAILHSDGELGQPKRDEFKIVEAYNAIEPHLRKHCRVVCLVEVADEDAPTVPPPAEWSEAQDPFAWPPCAVCGKSATEGKHATDLGEGHDYVHSIHRELQPTIRIGDK